MHGSRQIIRSNFSHGLISSSETLFSSALSITVTPRERRPCIPRSSLGLICAATPRPGPESVMRSPPRQAALGARGVCVFVLNKIGLRAGQIKAWIRYTSTKLLFIYTQNILHTHDRNYVRKPRRVLLSHTWINLEYLDGGRHERAFVCVWWKQIAVSAPLNHNSEIIRRSEKEYGCCAGEFYINALFWLPFPVFHVTIRAGVHTRNGN